MFRSTSAFVILLSALFFIVACEADPADAYPVAVRDKLDFVAEPTDADCTKLRCDPEITIVAYASDAVGTLSRDADNIILGATFDSNIVIYVCNPEEFPAVVEYTALPDDSLRIGKSIRFDAVLRDACSIDPARFPTEAAFFGVLTAAEIIDE